MAWHDNIWDEMNRLQRRIDGIFGSGWSNTGWGKEKIMDECSTG